VSFEISRIIFLLLNVIWLLFTGLFSRSNNNVNMSILSDLYGNEDLRGAEWLDIGFGHSEFLLALGQFTPQPAALKGSEPNAKEYSSVESQV
jgi:hypothetical protein